MTHQPKDLTVRYEMAFASATEFDDLSLSGQYRHHARGSYYSNSGGHRVVIYPDQRIYISSEAFGTGSHVAEISGEVFRFNDSPRNELVGWTHPDFTTAMLDDQIAGDEKYPIPLSVSFRKHAYI